MPSEVTWLGHASALVDLEGVRILVDPVVTDRVWHLRRRKPAPARSLRHADVVLISHAHHDHLHRPSLRAIASASPGIPVVVPAGVGRYVDGLGFGAISELVAGAECAVAGVDITATPAEHPGGRWLRDRYEVTALGAVLRRSSAACYVAGDTDLFAEMTALGRIDLALLPIGGWWKHLGPGHLDPERAAEAVARLRPRSVLPVHWGTFAPGLTRDQPSWLATPGAQFEAALRQRGLSDRLLRLEPGGTATWA